MKILVFMVMLVLFGMCKLEIVAARRRYAEENRSEGILWIWRGIITGFKRKSWFTENERRRARGPWGRDRERERERERERDRDRRRGGGIGFFPYGGDEDAFPESPFGVASFFGN